MGLQLTTDEQISQTQEELRGLAVPASEEIGNVALATNMAGPAFFTLGSHRYIVPPVPYVLAAELEELRLKMDQLATMPGTVETNAQVKEVFDRAIVLFRRACKPTFGIYRLLWRWVTNPFRDLSPLDAGTLLYFFCQCRMRSAIRLEASLVERKSRSSTTLQLT